MWLPAQLTTNFVILGMVEVVLPASASPGAISASQTASRLLVIFYFAPLVWVHQVLCASSVIRWVLWQKCCCNALYIPHLPLLVLSLCCGHSCLGGKTGLASSAAPVLSDPSKSLSALSSLSLDFAYSRYTQNGLGGVIIFFKCVAKLRSWGSVDAWRQFQKVCRRICGLCVCVKYMHVYKCLSLSGAKLNGCVCLCISIHWYCGVCLCVFSCVCVYVCICMCFNVCIDKSE